VRTPEEEARYGDVVQQAEQIAHAALDSTVTEIRPFTLIVCDVDVPCVVANGDVYVQTTLQGFHDAVSAALLEFLSSLEARISEARSTALASADSFPQVHFERLDEPHLGGSGEQR